jgi:hypothetical protein
LGNLEEGLSTGDCENWMKGTLGMEHFPLKRLHGGDLRGSSFVGDPGRYVRKVSGCGHLYGGPFPFKGKLVCGGGGARISGTLIDE